MYYANFCARHFKYWIIYYTLHKLYISCVQFVTHTLIFRMYHFPKYFGVLINNNISKRNQVAILQILQFINYQMKTMTWQYLVCVGWQTHFIKLKHHLTSTPANTHCWPAVFTRLRWLSRGTQLQTSSRHAWHTPPWPTNTDCEWYAYDS